VIIRAVDGNVVTSDVDLMEATGHLVARIKGLACTASASLSRAFSPEPPAHEPPLHESAAPLPTA
jgi:hypothetical protein